MIYVSWNCVDFLYIFDLVSTVGCVRMKEIDYFYNVHLSANRHQCRIRDILFTGLVHCDRSLSIPFRLLSKYELFTMSIVCSEMCTSPIYAQTLIWNISITIREGSFIINLLLTFSLFIVHKWIGKP